MMSRSSFKRKYQPGFEALERKQLLSAGPLIRGTQRFERPTSPFPSHAERGAVIAYGTGTGIRIVTS